MIDNDNDDAHEVVLLMIYGEWADSGIIIIIIII
jgi:hypothetical protein